MTKPMQCQITLMYFIMILCSSMITIIYFFNATFSCYIYRKCFNNKEKICANFFRTFCILIQNDAE